MSINTVFFDVLTNFVRIYKFPKVDKSIKIFKFVYITSVPLEPPYYVVRDCQIYSIAGLFTGNGLDDICNVQTSLILY